MRIALLSLSLAAGCATAMATPTDDMLAATGVADLRARGPAGLDAALATYDAMPLGRERDAMALAVDAVAAQRYATESRLYWYTDLAAAEAAAHARHVPILSLRMLGRLDEDLSCANSRLVRATLYANRELSQFLRDHFVLYWSSERSVPRVTIDFGDGRRIERTTTGNSAHYVLDEHGRVVDVLPGLYAPIAFRRELEASFAVATRVAPLADAAAANEIARYQQGVALRARADRERVASAPIVDGLARLATADDVAAARLERAQRATMSKAAVEVSDLRRFGYEVDGPSRADTAAWATAGQMLYGIAAGSGAPSIFDGSSRALIARLHDDVAPELRASPAQLAAVIARLEQHVVADSAVNQLQLRLQIAAHIADDIAHTGATPRFDDLNAWIYDRVFATPRSDAWLGLAPRDEFTGLPGDGIHMSALGTLDLQQ